jgi:hypothetical protein
MPTPTYTPLANITLSSSAASVTFSSISQAYRDLVLVCVSSVNYSGGSTEITLNGSGSGYNYIYMSGNGSTTSTSSSTNQGAIGTTGQFSPYTANEPLQTTVQIMDYSVTDKHKPILLRQGPASRGVTVSATRWANTAAVTSITFASSGLLAGSSFALYGIAA